MRGGVDDGENWDLRMHHFKNMLYSIQFSAGPKNIRPGDGLPASLIKFCFSFENFVFHSIVSLDLLIQ